MPQCSETHFLTRFLEHTILSESGPIRACSYTRDNPLVTYSGMPKTYHYFTYDPLRRVCSNDLACVDPLMVACYLGMPESIRREGIPGIVACKIDPVRVACHYK